MMLYDMIAIFADYAMMPRYVAAVCRRDYAAAASSFCCHYFPADYYAVSLPLVSCHTL